MSAPVFSTDLWQRLAAYEIGPTGAALSFTARLARENRWTESYAARVILEYKRFCYLAVTQAQDAIPSQAVDQVWHLHLTYSRDYWDEFCTRILGKQLHHVPTKGDAAEKQRHIEHYASTLLAYETVFDEPPPFDIWPDTERRFANLPEPRRPSFDDVMILDRRFAMWGSAGWIGLGIAIAVLVGVLI